MNKTTVNAQEPTPVKKFRGNITLVNNLGILAALVILIALFSSLSPVFFSVENFVNILVQVSMLCICAVGMTFVILSGAIDLSMGSILGASGIIMAALLQNKAIPPVLITIIAIVAGRRCWECGTDFWLPCANCLPLLRHWP
ncbi:MAG: ABC transporter permease [Bacillota bacterium]